MVALTMRLTMLDKRISILEHNFDGAVAALVSQQAQTLPR